MASILPGYEYDIFISYRQNDNRSGWVTQFVSALKEELAATVKEPVSAYIDTDPHEGLLETHNVDKSLELKLKCLIFIPIISQTYCDSSCFAWQNEFLAFNKIAKEDHFGRDITLANGNVTSRILPVKIHNLDPEDKTLLENELGGTLRYLEFIYHEAGVNRPLRPKDDIKANLNKTQYRNQVNKTANAVKEIITALKNFGNEKKDLPDKSNIPVKRPEMVKVMSHKLKIAFWSFIIIVLLVSGYFFLLPLFNTSTGPVDKSIAVLPLEYMSKDPGQEYFSDGMMNEILNHLFMVGGLKIPSATSSMRYKGTKLSVREIARELGVSFVLEGSVSISGNNIRINVRLINGENEQVLWTEDYKRSMTAIDLLDIQSDVAQKVAESLHVVLNPEVKKRIKARPTENTDAYLLFLQASQGNVNIEFAQQLLEKAIVLDPGFADAYAKLAFYWLVKGNDLYGNLNRSQVLEKAEPLLKKALELDKNSVMVHTYLASIRLWYYWDFEAVEKEFKITTELNPSSADIYLEFAQYLIIAGKFEEALILANKSFSENDITSVTYVTMALAYFFGGQEEKALKTVETYLHIFQNDNYIINNSIRIYVSAEKYEKVVELFEKNLANSSINELSDSYLGYLSIAFFKTGRKSRSTNFLNELISKSVKLSPGSPSFFAAAVYIAMDEKNKALQLLQKAYSDHEAEMVWLKVDPLFRPLHGDPQYEDLLQKVGFSFEQDERN